MTKYLPPTLAWVREQVELYESSGGTKGTTLRDTGLPCVLVTHTGNKTGAIRKTPLMKVKVKESYVLVGSQGGAPKNPQWVKNLRINDKVERIKTLLMRGGDSAVEGEPVIDSFSDVSNYGVMAQVVSRGKWAK